MLTWCKDKKFIELGFGNKLQLIEALTKPSNIVFINAHKLLLPRISEEIIACSAHKNVPAVILNTTDANAMTIQDFISEAQKYLDRVHFLLHTNATVLPEVFNVAYHISFEFPTPSKAKTALINYYKKNGTVLDEFDAITMLRMVDNIPLLLNDTTNYKVPKNWFFGLVYAFHAKLPKDILRTYDEVSKHIKSPRLYLVMVQYLQDLIYMKQGRTANSFVPNSYLEELSIDRLKEMIKETIYILNNNMYKDIMDAGNLYCNGIPKETDSVDISELGVI